MSETLKILYLLHDSRRSGVPAAAAHFIRRASSLDLAPTVLFAYDGIYAQELRLAGIPVVTLGARTAFLWRAKRFLMNFFLLTHGRKFDVIHIHSLKLTWSVLVARLMGLRVVFHLHELPRRISWLLRTAIGAADCVVFCSRTCADHFSAVPAKKRRIVVNALEVTDHPAVVHTAENNRIVMVGSINRNKGQDLLLKAFVRLKNSDAELWLYGTVGLSAHKFVHDLKSFAETAGVADRVFFPGPTSDVYAVFARAALVVHTSWTESFGIALVEAQSCGVPVIAHNIEGMREVVVDGSSGYLIPPGDVDSLAARIDELLADPGLRSRMGAAGRTLVRERFSMEQRAGEYLQLYKELCAP
ncbi:MAG: glycosyltransferase family 4 protein [Desulfuromonadaceae bacterium]